MDLRNIGSISGATYPYTNRTQKTTAGRMDFAESLQEAGAERIEDYRNYLQSKYGKVTIQSIGSDRASLDRVGKSMSGSDVIIAPNILEQMAGDQEKAAYYEKKIDDFFEAVPGLMASFASKGLIYEPGGVVVHEDGKVTYVSGCSDSPERVAEVNAINKAKREKEAEQRRARLEKSQAAADEEKFEREAFYEYNRSWKFLPFHL